MEKLNHKLDRIILILCAITSLLVNEADNLTNEDKVDILKLLAEVTKEVKEEN